MEVAIYVLTTIGLTIFQRRLQYFPDRRLVDPARGGMSGVEDLRLTTVGGETLVAWYVPAQDGHPLILYSHGNGGALADRAPCFYALTASGYGFLEIVYRGYGGSSRASPTRSRTILVYRSASRSKRAAYRMDPAITQRMPPTSDYSTEV
jgi:uncharacterized protein